MKNPNHRLVNIEVFQSGKFLQRLHTKQCSPFLANALLAVLFEICNAKTSYICICLQLPTLRMLCLMIRYLKLKGIFESVSLT